MADTGKRTVSILGSTGSIGVNTVDVIRQLGGRDRFDVVAITGNSNIALLAEQASNAAQGSPSPRREPLQ